MRKYVAQAERSTTVEWPYRDKESNRAVRHSCRCVGGIWVRMCCSYTDGLVLRWRNTDLFAGTTVEPCLRGRCPVPQRGSGRVALRRPRPFTTGVLRFTLPLPQCALRRLHAPTFRPLRALSRAASPCRAPRRPASPAASRWQDERQVPCDELRLFEELLVRGTIEPDREAGDDPRIGGEGVEALPAYLARAKGVGATRRCSSNPLRLGIARRETGTSSLGRSVVGSRLDWMVRRPHVAAHQNGRTPR